MGLEPELSKKIARLQGPILVLGASGFVGANLLLTLLAERQDAFGTSTHTQPWRLEGVDESRLRVTDLLVESNIDSLLDDVRPRTVFNCIAYGAYSFETDSDLVYQTNFNMTARLLSRLSARGIASYVHAGSSSEYGDNAAGPDECQLPAPNSDYAVSKVACANLLRYYGVHRHLPCVNLRLYSVYGPLEDSSRLLPNVIREGVEGRYPPFVNPATSRDFVYVDDVCEAFCDAALNLTEVDYGASFNIGSGHKTTIAEIAQIAKEAFQIEGEPVFSMPNRAWDVTDWYANPSRALERLGWQPRTPFAEGLARMVAWYRNLENKERYQRASKRFGLDTRHSVSAIVACYKDNQAIPIMVQRLKATFERMNIDYEIILVNDNSPDDTEEVIRAISRHDRRVIGISHSRNFGSQAAFKSGMEIATKNACVLLDGDLQDPPELIESFVAKWREGFDVVYGRRVKREAPWHMQIAYKLFYRIFDKFSYIRIPHDAGDFSLIDRRVVQKILLFPERDLFLRGIRAFVGFKQTGVDYVRPERMFGRSTNNLSRNIGWAKKGILSFSNTPLTMLSYFGTLLFVVSIAGGILQAVLKLLFPAAAPRGITTLLLLVLFFGSINLFAIGIIGEYIAKIFEEVKQRPHFVRRSIIRDGEIRIAGD
jgi:dolichol-phosphate mannosyltransferase